MSVEQQIDPVIIGATALAASDGLLTYLRVLYRVAHDPVASHWCTPGHNRGGDLAVPPAEPFIATPRPLVRREQ